jgi:parallel beta-helix repeat protein
VFKDTFYENIRAEYMYASMIDENYFFGVRGLQGLYLHYGEGNIISNNFLDDNDDGGIYVQEADYNMVVGNFAQASPNGYGIMLWQCDYCVVNDNTCKNNDTSGIKIRTCLGCLVAGNLCENNDENIYLDESDHCAVVGNSALNSYSDNGIRINSSDYNLIEGNLVQENDDAGIELDDAHHNAIIGNHIIENSQCGDNQEPNLELLSTCNYNFIQGNFFRAGALAAKPKYAIEMTSGTGNTFIDNDLYDDGYGTGVFLDTGTDTKFNVIVVPFVDGSDPQDSGYLIDADTEYARSYLRLPEKVNQVMSMKVYARSVVLEADAMRGEFKVYGGADNEAYNTHDGSVADHPSTSSNFAADDVIFWTLVTAGVLALLGGDSVEVKVLHEAAGGDDCATEAYFRTVEIAFV